MTAEGMNRSRYNATASNVLKALKSVLDQSTFMMSQHVIPAGSEVAVPVGTWVDAQDKVAHVQDEIAVGTQEECSTSRTSATIDIVNESPVMLNEVNLRDPVTVCHHAQHGRFRRHKDIADVLQPPKKQKHRTTDD